MPMRYQAALHPVCVQLKIVWKMGEANDLTQVLLNGFQLAQYFMKQNVYLSADTLLIGFFFELFLGARYRKILIIKHIFNLYYRVNGFTVI